MGSDWFGFMDSWLDEWSSWFGSDNGGGTLLLLLLLLDDDADVCCCCCCFICCVCNCDGRTGGAVFDWLFEEFGCWLRCCFDWSISSFDVDCCSSDINQ